MSRVAHVGFYVPGWPLAAFPNGVVSYVHNLRDALAKQNVGSWVLAGETKVGAIAPECHPLDLSRNRSWWARARDAAYFRFRPHAAFLHHLQHGLVRSLAQALVQRPTDVFEIEESFGMSASLTRANLLPVVVRLHGPWCVVGSALGMHDDGGFDFRVASEGQAIRIAHALTAPSRDVLDRVRAHYRLELPHAQVIPNPGPVIPPEQRWTLEGSEPGRLLFVGRFDRVKGGDLAIMAFARLAAKHPNAKLWFVGPDAGFRDDRGRFWKLAEFIEDQIEDRGIRARIEVLGPKPPEELAGLRARARVVMIPSRYETLGLTVLEALASGSPMVAAAVGGIVDAVEDGKTGLHFKAGDAEDLALHLAALLTNDDLCSRLASGARSDDRFRPDVVAAQTRDYYAEVVARWRTTPRTRAQ